MRLDAGNNPYRRRHAAGSNGGSDGFAAGHARFAGYRSRVFETAQRVFQLQPEIGLVISDYDLVDGTGRELLEWIRSRRNVPFLLISGTYRITAEEGFEFIAKPFDLNRLREKAQALLGLEVSR